MTPNMLRSLPSRAPICCAMSAATSGCRRSHTKPSPGADVAPMSRSPGAGMAAVSPRPRQCVDRTRRMRVAGEQRQRNKRARAKGRTAGWDARVEWRFASPLLEGRDGRRQKRANRQRRPNGRPVAITRVVVVAVVVAVVVIAVCRDSWMSFRVRAVGY
jgi:hypothetical protein